MLLSALQQGVDESRNQNVLILRIRLSVTFRCSFLSHSSFCLPSCLRLFCSVFRPALLAILHALRIKRPAYDVVPNTREILHSSAPDHDQRVLLQIMSFSGDISDHFFTVRQPDFRHLPQRGIGLLGGRGIHSRADTALLRA